MEAARLREQLAAGLTHRHILRDPAVARAMRSVPRELFAPDAGVEAAYEDRVIRIKEADGTLVSSLSQPAMIVEMLQQLDVRPGDRILEIGTGTGYTTALLSLLTGPDGFVATVDIEDDLVALARERFASLGLDNIAALASDGARGFARYAPFDRILLTVAATDIERAWWEQLAAGGKIVLPLSLGGAQKSVAFSERDGALVSEGAVDCAFLTLRGLAESAKVVHLSREPEIVLQYDQDAVAPDLDALTRRLTEEDPLRTHIGDGFAPKDFDGGAAFWIGLNDARFCRLEFIDGAGRRSSAGLCENDSIALLDFRGAALYVAEFGNAQHLAERLRTLVAAWDAAGRPGRHGIHITALRREDTRTPSNATAVVERPVTRFFVRMD